MYFAAQEVAIHVFTELLIYFCGPLSYGSVLRPKTVGHGRNQKNKNFFFQWTSIFEILDYSHLILIKSTFTKVL